MTNGSGPISPSPEVIPPSHLENGSDTLQTVLSFAAVAAHVFAAKITFLTAAIARHAFLSHRDARKREERENEASKRLDENEKAKQGLMAQTNAGISFLGTSIAQTNEGLAALGIGIAQTNTGIAALGTGVAKTNEAIALLVAGITQTNASMAALAGSVQELTITTDRIFYVLASVAVAACLALIIATTVWVDRQSIAFRALPASAGYASPAVAKAAKPTW